MPIQARAYRATFATVLLLGCAIAMAADKVTELSEEFLEYLASMESDDENWTDFAAANPAQPKTLPVAKVVASSSSSSSMSVASSAAKVDK